MSAPNVKGKDCFGYLRATLTGQIVVKIVTASDLYWTYQITGNANRMIVTFHFELEMKAARQ
ncbi:MAG: hypothetical protein CME33_13895 [Gimesia sp.]|nr:hypothetical protein [Gimesia sp.]